MIPIYWMISVLIGNVDDIISPTCHKMSVLLVKIRNNVLVPIQNTSLENLRMLGVPEGDTEKNLAFLLSLVLFEFFMARQAHDMDKDSILGRTYTIP